MVYDKRAGQEQPEFYRRVYKKNVQDKHDLRFTIGSMKSMQGKHDLSFTIGSMKSVQGKHDLSFTIGSMTSGASMT